MTDESRRNSSSSERHAQLDEVLAELMRAFDIGEHVDEEQWLHRHPEFVDELRQFFAKQEQIEQLVRPLRQSYANGLHVRCPHCHNPIELLDESPLSEIACPSCGSSFSLVGEAATTRYLPGEKTFAHFELLNRVGVGQFGSVWKARDTKLDRFVAIKIPRSDELDDSQAEMFIRDARASAQLKHPNIVSVHEVGKQDTTIYIVSDFVEGETLKDRLAKGRLTPRESAELCVKIARALHHAHESGVIHRDLKPGNVMMDSEDEPHIVDFGLAKREMGEITMTIEGQILGTPAYMSPEQARGEGHKVDRRADIYALGVILFEILTGELPFRGDKQMLLVQILNDEPPSARSLNQNIPRDLDTICSKSMSKESSGRYRNAHDLARDLARFIAGIPIDARRINQLERALRWSRRHPLVASLTAATLILLITVTAVTTLGYFREASLRRRAIGLQTDMQQLQNEAAQMQSAVKEMEQRRSTLNASLQSMRTNLDEGQDKLMQTYLDLARTAIEQGHLQLADYYLRQCPEGSRNAYWNELQQTCVPIMSSFDAMTTVSALSSDGSLIVGVGDDSRINLWDLASGKILHSLDLSPHQIKALTFGPNKQAVAIGAGPLIWLWNLESNTVVQELSAHELPITDLEFSPDGRVLASASSAQKRNETGGLVVLNDAKSFVEIARLDASRFATFSHDGRWLATGGGLWRITGDHNQWTKEADHVLNYWGRPIFHPTENLLALRNGPRGLTLWDVERKRVRMRIFSDVSPSSIVFDRNGSRVAYAGTCSDTGGSDAAVFKVEVCRLDTLEKELSLPWFRDELLCLGFSMDGTQLLTNDGRTVGIWEANPQHDPTEQILNSIARMDVGPLDWPQWGGSSARVNTPLAHNLPRQWDIGDGVHPRGSQTRSEFLGPRVPSNSKNIKWAVPLGNETYGNPVVANGRIFVGTNNQAGYVDSYPPSVDLGVLLCFEEQTGRFLWQHSNEKLDSGNAHDWPSVGVCSTPLVNGKRLWYVNNRAEVVCLDTEGFQDNQDDGVKVNQPGYPLFESAARITPHSNWRQARKLLQHIWALHELEGDANWLRLTNADLTGRPIIVIGKNDTSQRMAEIEYSGKNLIIKKVVAQDGSRDSQHWATVESDVTSGLDERSVSELLRHLFLQAKVELPAEVQVEVHENQRHWSLHVNLDGTPQSFDLRERDDRLVVRRVVTPMDMLHEADVVWKFDMMSELGVSQKYMTNCSVTAADGRLFVCTSNGVDEEGSVRAPDSPSFIALECDSGRVLWTDNSPGEFILHAQWASPSYGVFNGQPQVIFPGGDGWLYSFDPKGDGEGGSRLLWKFDLNPKESKYEEGGYGNRHSVIAFPAVYDGLVYVTVGTNPEFGDGGRGHLWCINPAKKMDGSDISPELAVDRTGLLLPRRRVQAVVPEDGERAVSNPDSGLIWHYSEFDRDEDGELGFEETFHVSISTPVIKDDILYITDYSGLLHCLNAKSGRVYWTYDSFSGIWGSPLLADDKLYLADGEGEILVFRHYREPRAALRRIQSSTGRPVFEVVEGQYTYDLLGEFDMGSAIYMTPIVANNVMYVATRNTLYAVASSGSE